MTWRDRLGLISFETAGKRKVGTGFWVTPNRVLTARHAVAGAPSLTIFPVTGGQVDVQAAAILWRGEDPLDAAVIAAEHPAPGDWPPLGENAPPIRETCRCESAGFPLVTYEAPRGKELGDQVFNLKGSLYPPTAKRQILQFSVDESFLNIDLLGGISGAPVVVNQRLFGILLAGPRALNGDSLNVVSIHSLRDAPGFADHLGLPPIAEQCAAIESRCHELRERVELLLRTKVLLRSELATFVKRELGQPADSWPSDDRDRLLEEICTRLRTGPLLRICLELSRKLPREEGLEEALTLLVPIVYWNELDRYRAKISKDWMRLPVVEAAYAEIVQAAFDGRRLELFCTPDSPLRSKLAIDAPQLPETSISTALKSQELVEHLHHELVGKARYQEGFLRKDQFEVTDRMPPAQKARQRSKIINHFLEREQRERKRVYFLLIDKLTYESYGRQAENFLGSFRALLPALRLVVLEGDMEQYADETIGIEDLRQFLIATKEA